MDNNSNKKPNRKHASRRTVLGITGAMGVSGLFACNRLITKQDCHIAQADTQKNNNIELFIDIRKFGAKADSLDDKNQPIYDADLALTNYHAINAAIEAAGLGDTVYIPAGVFTIRPPDKQPTANGITIQDKAVVLAGAGVSATTIRYRGRGTAVEFKQVQENNWNHQGAGLRDLKITWLDSSQTSQAHGVRFSNNFVFFSIERVWIRHFWKGDGLQIGDNRPGYEPQDGYLAHVHLQDCKVGLRVFRINQATAINLMVNQNRSIGAVFEEANMFRWVGGLVQSSDDIGVLFAPPKTGSINNVTLDGIWFESFWKTAAVQIRRPPPPHTTGATNLTIQNCHLGRPTEGGPMTWFDLSNLSGITILNNRFFFDEKQDTLLKLENISQGLIGSGTAEYWSKDRQQLIQTNGYVNVTWLAGGTGASGAGLGVDTARPPIAASLETRSLLVEDGIVNAPGLQHGKVTVPQGATSVEIRLMDRSGEPNANFWVLATPTWNTTFWIDNLVSTKVKNLVQEKCRINFGSSAPNNAAVYWQMTRLPT